MMSTSTVPDYFLETTYNKCLLETFPLFIRRNELVDYLFLLLVPVLFVSTVDDDGVPASDVSRLLLLCPLEALASCDVSDISSANNLYLYLV